LRSGVAADVSTEALAKVEDSAKAGARGSWQTRARRFTIERPARMNLRSMAKRRARLAFSPAPVCAGL
jgi:hypothetical protein